MIKVWVLILAFNGAYGGPNDVVIDNIATQADCLKLEAVIKAIHSNNYAVGASACVEITKAR